MLGKLLTVFLPFYWKPKSPGLPYGLDPTDVEFHHSMQCKGGILRHGITLYRDGLPFRLYDWQEKDSRSSRFIVEIA